MSSIPVVPEPVAHIAAVMSTYPRPWALCGGWAVDAWLGRVTRDHGDVDITVFHDDQRALFEHLADWNLVAHDADEPQATEPWDGRALALPAHIHARPPGAENAELVRRWVTPPYSQANDGRDIEFILNEHRDGAWLLNAEPRAAVTRDVCVPDSPWAVPAFAPEVIAFFKATAYLGQGKLWARPHDVSDFEQLFALLQREQREWLRGSVAAAYPRHPWLPDLVPVRPPAKE